MAATASAWSKPGAWALDSEENEAELLEQHKIDSSAANNRSKGGETAEFPSLSAAATTRTKKKKAQPLSLQQFSTYSAPKAAAEVIVLPTGPRERSAEELDRTKLGGGFRSYGGGIRDEQPRRQGSFNRESNREFTSSRADDTDNWATGKGLPVGVGGGFDRRERGERGGFFGDSQSRGDEVDNWALNKSFVPSEPRRNERQGGFGLESNNGGADSGNWLRRKEEEGGRKMRGAFDSLSDRRGGLESNNADSESWGRKREEGVVASGGGSGSRPRLNLQPRTLPVGEEQKSEMVKPKGGSPFGEARPREEVLKEKGQDWKEIEQKLESTKLANGAAVIKKNLWSGNGRERLQRQETTERAWRKPESVGSRPQSAGESENGPAENTENALGEQTEEKDDQI